MEPTLTTAAPSAAPYAHSPWKFCCIDLETDNAKPDEVERELALTFRGNLTLKPETIGRKYLEAIDKKSEKMALLDGAPIRVVTIKSDTELLCLHDLSSASGACNVAGFDATVANCESERELLSLLRGVLDSKVSDGTPLVGHNIKHFDLRKLRHRFLINGLQLPACLSWKDQPIFDTMLHYVNSVSLRGQIMISLSDVLDELRLTNHKSELNGAQVPRYIAEGRHDELIEYALKDVLSEAELYLRLIGQAGDIAVSAT